MIPELGHLLLYFALGAAIAQGVLPLVGAQRGNVGWMSLGRPLALAQALLVLAAYICLTYSFIYNDFSVLYVASNSNSALPIQYRIAAKNNPKAQLLDLLRTEHPGDAGIVYCLSRASVETTAQYLVDHGIPALPYHAGLNSGVRAWNQARFLREDALVMVATTAFGSSGGAATPSRRLSQSMISRHTGAAPLTPLTPCIGAPLALPTQTPTV